MRHTLFILFIIILASCTKKKDFQKAPEITIEHVIPYSSTLYPETMHIFQPEVYEYAKRPDSVYLQLVTSSQTNLNQISVYGNNCAFDFNKNGFMESNLGETLKRTGFSTSKTDTLKFMLIPNADNFTFSIQSFNDHNLYNTKNISFSVVN